MKSRNDKKNKQKMCKNQFFSRKIKKMFSEDELMTKSNKYIFDKNKLAMNFSENLQISANLTCS